MDRCRRRWGTENNERGMQKRTQSEEDKKMMKTPRDMNMAPLEITYMDRQANII
jgi:hypothetical protein